nr:tRNA (guanosine(46)-N7)-methyltransferase TrmB [Lachnospiraceae bacterium]
MRLRNIPGSREKIQEFEGAIKDPQTKKGAWAQEFQNDHPIHIEIGMGKGRFLMDMAKAHPEINYIGIEKFSSV